MSLFLVAIIWGGGFVAVKDALNCVKPFQMMAIRFVIATLLMVIIFWKKLKFIKKADVLAGTVAGFFLFTGFALQTIGLQYTTAGKQAFLTGTYVVIVPFLYWALTHKRPDIYSIVATIIAFIGISLLTLEGKLTLGIGDILTLLCALFFAAQIVAIDFYTEKHDPILLTIVQSISVMVFSVIGAVLFEGNIESFTTSGVASIVYLGLFSTFLAFIVQNVAQKYTSSTHTAIILSLESFFGSVFAVMLLHEHFTMKMILGCIFIFIAIITAETKWSFLPLKVTKENYAQ